MPDIRFVVIHQPGPAWQAGVQLFEQVGLQAHIDHYRQWQQQGLLLCGGPFTDPEAGGMMVPRATLDHDTVVQFALADPAVRSGLLTVTIRPWLMGMQHPDLSL